MTSHFHAFGLSLNTITLIFMLQLSKLPEVVRFLFSGWYILFVKSRENIFLVNDLSLRKWFQFSLIQLNVTCSKVDLWFLVLSLSHKVIHNRWMFCLFSYVFASQDNLHKRSRIFIQVFEKSTICSTAWTVNGNGVDLFIFFLCRVCLYVKLFSDSGTL